MSQQTRQNLLSPVARIVQGNLYKPNTTDFDGKPLVVKTGPNAGQARSDYFFAIAIPKGPEPHWAHTAWGGIIWQVGNAAFPNAAQRPDFAWKIEDGDSQIPNKRGRKPIDQEGWRGHWILRFSGGFAPKIYRQEGTGFVQEMTVDFVKPGYFVEVSFNVDGNGNQNNPGVYLNHSMVCFRAYGPEINFGPDVNEVGFGQTALPAGASAVPLASNLPLPSGQPTGVMGAGLPLPIAAAAPSPIPIIPNPQFLQVPLPGAASAANLPPIPAATATAISPSSAPPPPPAAGPQMTALAKGVTYQAYKTSGWSDEQMRAAGLLV